mgnify:FL=1
MAEETPQSSKETQPKTNKKNIFLFVGLIVVSSLAAFYIIKNKSAEKNEIFDIDPLEDSSANDTISSTDSIITLDTNDINKVEENEIKVNLPKKRTKKTVSKSSLENNPKNWVVSKGSNSDTSFYLLKNKKTGTKLSNKFYSKKMATDELRNLKNILSK